MDRNWRSTLHPAYTGDVERDTNHPVSWGAIAAGVVTAIALTLALMAVGSGFGLMTVSVWPGVGASSHSFSIGAAIWLIVVQWVSSAVGGYIAGRMRTRWHSLHTHEVFFRDTAHGLITWATATTFLATVAVISATIAGMGASNASVAVDPATTEMLRKAAANTALFAGLSMLVGGFIACVAAVIGGELRDQHP